jgi:hypothetical protein
MGTRMDLYHAYFDLKPGVKDLELARDVAGYMNYLKSNGLIEDWRLTRRKLGLGPRDLGEFHLMMETKDMAQLDAAFGHVASRREPVEGLHWGVNSKVTNLTFALYRDFPDPVRHEGQENF